MKRKYKKKAKANLKRQQKIIQKLKTALVEVGWVAKGSQEEQDLGKMEFGKIT